MFSRIRHGALPTAQPPSKGGGRREGETLRFCRFTVRDSRHGFYSPSASRAASRTISTGSLSKPRNTGCARDRSSFDTSKYP